MLDVPVLEQVETGWSESAIMVRCRTLRDTLHARRVPTADLEAMAPGGARNQTADPLGAAVVWYALLRARFEVEEVRRAQDEAHAEEAVALALAGDGHPLTLSAPDMPTAVYPKSYHALRFCESLDVALRRVVASAEQLEALDVQALAPLAESLAVRLWAWILTHPEPGLPFDETAAPEPPAWTTRLTPDDLLRLLAAHLEVNRIRITRIAQLFPGEAATESRLSLAGFLGTIAQELGHRPFDVLRRWSLGEAFAQAVVAAQASREARAAADTAAKGAA